LSSPILVDDIDIEPTSEDETFVLYGTRNNQGVLVHLDFSQLHERICDDSDYEYWIPKGENRSPCIQGESLVYKRRKANAECFNPNGLTLVQSSRCGCTTSDYQCDYCFEKGPTFPNSTLFSCINKCNSVGVEVPENCVGSYNVTRGYRLVAGTKCDFESGLDLRHKTLPCPAISNNNASKKSYALYISVAIAGSVLLILAGISIYIASSPSRRRAVMRFFGKGERLVSYKPLSVNEEEDIK